jgi:hypothetical protein
MKNGRSHRRHSRHHGQTPAVICLPAPRPPIMTARKEADVPPALPLRDQPEALVAANDQDSHQSRQLRRQARRAEVKAMRRGPEPHSATPSAESLAPLPRNRALTALRRPALQRVGAWLRSLVMKQPRNRMSQDNAVAHLKAMRTEVARMQRTLDWMLNGAPAQ